MERKGEGKPPETLCFLSKKRKGVEAYSLLPQAELRPVQYSTQSALGGGVLSCSESTPVLQGSHHILFTIVCGWRKKKKKEEGALEGKKTCLFVQETGKRACVYLRWPEKARYFPPTPTPGSIFSCSTRPRLHMCELLGPANSDTPASPDDESWRQTSFHEYWCGG